MAPPTARPAIEPRDAKVFYTQVRRAIAAPLHFGHGRESDLGMAAAEQRWASLFFAQVANPHTDLLRTGHERCAAQDGAPTGHYVVGHCFGDIRAIPLALAHGFAATQDRLPSLAIDEVVRTLLGVNMHS
jgi:hypothetical protein